MFLRLVRFGEDNERVIFTMRMTGNFHQRNRVSDFIDNFEVPHVLKIIDKDGLKSLKEISPEGKVSRELLAIAAKEELTQFFVSCGKIFAHRNGLDAGAWMKAWLVRGARNGNEADDDVQKPDASYGVPHMQRVFRRGRKFTRRERELLKCHNMMRLREETTADTLTTIAIEKRKKKQRRFVTRRQSWQRSFH
jgi:hypothetical protein